MTYIRTRLAAALREHSWGLDTCQHDEPSHENHLADVLLSLLGIAIVELPDRLPGYIEGEMPRWEIADAEIVVRRDPHGWVRLNSQALLASEARALAARLLAAADEPR